MSFARPPLPPFTLETAIAKVRAAEDGWNGRDAAKVADLADAAPDRVLPVALDVTKPDQIGSATQQAQARFGSIDVLVSNAGIQIVNPIEDYEYSDWKKMLAIHLDGAFLTTKACLKHMYAAKYGRVIYMGSVHSKEASKLKAPYVTAKHGLIGLAKVLAKEGAEFNVRANVVCPGPTDTPFMQETMAAQENADAVLSAMVKSVPMRRLAAPEEVASAVRYFVTDEAGYVTGQTLSVSGGLTMA